MLTEARETVSVSGGVKLDPGVYMIMPSIPTEQVVAGIRYTLRALN